MPYYIYACHDCELAAGQRLKRELSKDEYEELVLFETSHAIEPTPEELKEAITCPRCNGLNCTRTLYGYKLTTYVRGSGYLDRAGALRDMHLYHLINDDPYGQYRQPGEVDEIKARLKREGQYDSQRKYFTLRTETTTAVRNPTS